MNINLKENERIDDLQYKDLKIIQDSEGFCFGMDSVLLSDFAKDIKENAKIIDLGTGTGIISILLSKKIKQKKIIGVDIQKEVCDMAQRSVILNKLEDTIEIINEDIKNIEKVFEKGSFDAVITNPPYKKINTGLVNDNKLKLISRHEIAANLEDFIKVSSYLLKSNGSLYIVHMPERLADILNLLRHYQIEPKQMQVVYPQKNKEPNLILIKGVKNAKPFLKIKKPLFIYTDKGEYTEDILEIYGKGRKKYETENYIL